MNTSVAQRRPLGQILISEGILSEDQLRIALLEQMKCNQPIGKLLVSLGFVTEATLRQALSESLGKQSVDLSNAIIDPSALALVPRELADVEARLNERKPEGDQIKLTMAATTGDGRLIIHRNETPNEARLRHQQASSARSFHGAIWGSKANHAKVTAYDIAIGRGQAVTDREFYAYLCAVADWRLKKPDPKRPNRDGILSWDKFSELFDIYLKAEVKPRVEIIEGNSNYYSNGILPKYVKSIAECPKAVVTETTDGRTPPSKSAKGET